jgi:transposase-like protein
MIQSIDDAKALKEPTEAPNPQVTVRKTLNRRRSFTPAQKLRLLEAFDACENASARGAFLRKEGLYYAAISDWRKAFVAGGLTGNGKKTNATAALTQLDQLTRENEQLKKKLSQATAVLDLQKKVSELLGTHILPHDSSELKS